jgi:diaminohydroxyphosphoribosylaminopyrimidine deaminase/5-amino-6-(5-phosphoribosylamino)uracil reductase
MRQALALARRGYGRTSPNPMVGALLVRKGMVIGRGWHRQAGGPHAEIEALHDAARRGCVARGATLYVTLEPCCTQGRTPPCTDAVIAAGIRRVVAATVDPNPRHAGRGLRLLARAGIQVTEPCLAERALRLNEAFNHWIVQGTPWVIVKAAMTLDGKIATAAGESKWITGEPARAWATRLRQGVDAILVGVKTVLADDPALFARPVRAGQPAALLPQPWRVVLDTAARIPVSARLMTDPHAARTIVVVGRQAPQRRVEALQRRVAVWLAPRRAGRVDLAWVLRRLGAQEVTSLLVEGGGEVQAGFLEQHLAHRVAFFYAPKVLGGRRAHKAVAGRGAQGWAEIPRLTDLEWRRCGVDLLLWARVA